MCNWKIKSPSWILVLSGQFKRIVSTVESFVKKKRQGCESLARLREPVRKDTALPLLSQSDEHVSLQDNVLSQLWRISTVKKTRSITKLTKRRSPNLSLASIIIIILFFYLSLSLFFFLLSHKVISTRLSTEVRLVQNL